MQRSGSKTDTGPERTEGTLAHGSSGPTFLDALVDPAAVFRDPSEVVDDPRLTREEKRTILLSWVRDELVIEQVARRTAPDLGARSRIDAVIEALSHFDPCAAGEYLSAISSVRSRGAGRSKEKRAH